MSIMTSKVKLSLKVETGRFKALLKEITPVVIVKVMFQRRDMSIKKTFISFLDFGGPGTRNDSFYSIKEFSTDRTVPIETMMYEEKLVVGEKTDFECQQLSLSVLISGILRLSGFPRKKLNQFNFNLIVQREWEVFFRP